MINSTINISSAENLFESNNITISSSSNLIASDVVRISMQISDTSNDVVDASLNINSNGLKLDIYNSQEYAKHASLFFGSLFTGGFNADYMWQLLAAPTSEQINGSHLVDALSPIEADIQALADAFQLHFTNWNIHLTQEDRDFITRLKAIYGNVYNVALDYLILTNPYDGPINITNSQIALYAGFGGFSAYSSVTDIEVEYYNLLALPTKSGGIPTAEAYASQNNTYGFGITTLTIPTEEPLDLVQGEVGMYSGEGGFTSFSSNADDAEIIEGYFFEEFFYLDEEHTIPAEMLAGRLYVDLETNNIYRYDEEEEKFILVVSPANGGVVEGYFNPANDLFFEDFAEELYSNPIEGKPGTLYLDLTTKELFKYDELQEIFVVISSAVEPFVIQGFLNPVDNKFYSSYADGVYENEIRLKTNKVYFDLNTKFVYLYNQALNILERYHHKISVDYLVFNNDYPNDVTVGANQAAFYITNLGFSSTPAPIYDELFFGYFHNEEFFATDSYDTPVVGDGLVLYVDLSTNKIYRYDSITEAYVLLTSAAEGGGGTANIAFGYYAIGDFYSDSTLTTQVTPIEDGLYVDILTGDWYRYNTNQYTKLLSGTRIVHTDENSVTDVTLAIDRSSENPTQWIIRHNNTLLPNIYISSGITPSTSNVDSSVITRIATTLGHVTGITSLAYASDPTVSTLVLRNDDASIETSYIKLSPNYSYSNVSLDSQVGLFSGSGGFTALSAGDGVEIIYSWDDSSAQDEYSDGVYQAYIVRQTLNSLATRVALLEQGAGEGEGGPGTTDHNLLTHRFVANFEEEEIQVAYQHDIGVIQGLQQALNNLSAASTWSDNGLVIITRTQTTANNVTTYNNALSLAAITTNTGAVEALSTGTLLSTASTYIETPAAAATQNSEAIAASRVVTKIPVTYADSLLSGENVSNATIAKRDTNGALTASYYILQDGLQNVATPTSGMAVLYSGQGGFGSVTCNDNYFMYGDWPDQQDLPLVADSVISAQAIYDKVSDIYDYINNIDGSGLGGGGKNYISGPGINVSTQPDVDDNYKISLLPPVLEDVENEISAALGGVKYGFPKTEETNNIKYPLTAILQSGNAHAYEAYTQIDKASASTFGVVKLGSATNNLVISQETSNRVYGIGLTENGTLAVNVPWTGSTYQQGNGIVIDNNSNTLSVFLGDNSFTGNNHPVKFSAGHGLYVEVSEGDTIGTSYQTSHPYYGVRKDRNDNLYVEVPWSDDDTTYSASTGILIDSYNRISVDTDDLDGLGYIRGIKVNGSSSAQTTDDGILNLTVPSGSSQVEEDDPWFNAWLDANIESDSISKWNGYNSRISALENADYLTSSDLSDYVTTSALSRYGFLTSSDLDDYALESWVSSNFVGNSGNQTISGTLTATKFYDSSDIRLKKNIKELISVIDSIEDIPIVEYEMKRAEGSKYIGTLAQKLLPLFPELVGIDSEGYYNVDYSGLAAIAIQGIKELYRKLKDLESKVYGD